MKYFIVGQLFALMFLASNCMPSGPAPPKSGASVEEQATYFIKALVSNDVEGFADFALPEFVEKQGGREAMIAGFKKDIARFKADGTTFSNGKADSPSKMSNCNGTLQCVLRQSATMSFKNDPKPVVLNSNLIAVSRDNGQTWRFLQAGQDDLVTVRAQYPFICEDLAFQKY